MSDNSTQIHASRQELNLAEDAYIEATRTQRDAKKRVLRARTDCFVYGAFDADSREDKQLVKKYLLELVDENSPFGAYARKDRQLNTIFDLAAKLFELDNKSTDKYETVYKLPVVDDDEKTYGLTMTYNSNEAKIESKLLDF